MEETTREVPVGRHLAACPECGGRIQATIEVDLDDLVIAQTADRGEVIGYRNAQRRNEPVTLDFAAATAWQKIRVYCANDHDLTSLLQGHSVKVPR